MALEDIISDMLQSPVSLAVVLGTTAATYALLQKSRTRYAQPPGPPRQYLIGNTFDAPTENEWLTWTKWNKQYGAIVSLDIFGQLIVMLNTPEHMEQLLEKQSSVSSGRPSLLLAGKILGYENSIVFRQNDKQHREARRLANQAIGKANIAKYGTLVEHQMLKMTRHLMEDGGENVSESIRRAIGLVISDIVYGIDEKDSEKHILLAERVIDSFVRTTQPGAYAVDMFPILQYVPPWFPGGGYKRQVPRWTQDLRDMLDLPAAAVKDELARGISKTSVAHELFAGPIPDASREEDVKWVNVSLFLGGADTTSASIHVFIMAMVLYPQVQRTAQLELDSVLGQSHFPTLKDRAKLPYIDCVLKEVLRWHPIIPMGAPRKLTADEVLDGYFLPKGTYVLNNTWGLFHDEKYFPDPFDFIPERFMKSEEKGHPTALLDPGDFAFGFGRRVCPGRDLADVEMWLSFAIALYTLDIMPALDSHGQPILPKLEFTSGTISHPKPFKCIIKPRNSTTETMLKEL